MDAIGGHDGRCLRLMGLSMQIATEEESFF